MALEVKEGAVSQEMQTVCRSWSRQGNRPPPRTSREGHLVVGRDAHVGLLTYTTVR